ncbi:hypothetical protein KSS87_010503, partial [Heliosperma pusillum]
HQIKLQSYQSFSQFCRERKCDSVNWEEREDDLQKMESLNHHRRDLRRYHRLRRRRQSYCRSLSEARPEEKYSSFIQVEDWY